MSAPQGSSKQPHPATKYVWSWKEFGKYYDHSSFRMKAQLYSEQILITARLLSAQILPVGQSRALSYTSKNRGHLNNKLGYKGPNDPVRRIYIEDITVEPPALQAEKYLFRGVNTDKVIRSDFPYQFRNEWEYAHYSAIVKFARENGARITFLQIPRLDRNIETTKVFYGPDGPAVSTLAIPINDLFGSLSEEERENYFYNINHFNTAGSEYFSRALVDIFIQNQEH